MKNSSRSKKNKILIVIIIVIVLISIALIIGYSIKNHKSGSGTEAGDTVYGDAELGIDAGVDEALEGYRNVFIFGIDNENRSDIILLASINKKTDEVKLITVHRDTYMQLRDFGETFCIRDVDQEFFKCNHAYKKGGFYAAMKELNMNMDLNCHEGIGMDWETIEMLVDGIGGIDVDVTPAMLPYIKDSLIKSSGYQRLNGKQAVAYLRVRKDATAVQRAERNEAVFVQVFEKSKTLSKSKQLALLDELYERADSNMSKSTMADILGQLSSFDLEAKGCWPYKYNTYWEQDMSFYYFVPETLKDNVSRMHEVMFGQKGYTVTDTVKKISERIAEKKKSLVKN